MVEVHRLTSVIEPFNILFTSVMNVILLALMSLVNLPTGQRMKMIRIAKSDTFILKAFNEVIS